MEPSALPEDFIRRLAQTSQASDEETNNRNNKGSLDRLRIPDRLEPWPNGLYITQYVHYNVSLSEFI